MNYNARYIYEMITLDSLVIRDALEADDIEDCIYKNCHMVPTIDFDNFRLYNTKMTREEKIRIRFCKTNINNSIKFKVIDRTTMYIIFYPTMVLPDMMDYKIIVKYDTNEDRGSLEAVCLLTEY